LKADCPIKTILVIVAFGANAGVSPPELLGAAGLDPALLANPDAYLPHAQEMRLWDEAVRLSGDPDFGVHMAEWVARAPEDHFDVLAFAVRSCPTLGEHYRLAGRYMRLIHEGLYLSVEEEGDVARVMHGHIAERIGPRQPVEGMVALTLLVGRRALGEDFVPKAVRFTHDRPDRVSEQERVFGTEVQYGCPRNELVLDRALLERPQRHAEHRLLAILDRELSSQLSELPKSSSFVDVVRRCMMGELPDREPSVPAVAAKLRMSARSLQRRLQSEGTSFAEVLSELRRELSLRYLEDQRISIAEVAFLLGFLDVTGFHRAFKRWTGGTPAEYRRAAMQGTRRPAGRPG
jgi:AraC-like DNA-binding protein